VNIGLVARLGRGPAFRRGGGRAVPRRTRCQREVNSALRLDFLIPPEPRDPQLVMLFGVLWLVEPQRFVTAWLFWRPATTRDERLARADFSHARLCDRLWPAHNSHGLRSGLSRFLSTRGRPRLLQCCWVPDSGHRRQLFRRRVTVPWRASFARIHAESRHENKYSDERCRTLVSRVQRTPSSRRSASRSASRTLAG